ncbi:hypothetical protein TSOC_002488 [Tetrabaena socialis]|uniref:Uncharacterized protein n=1 Tax=Tetrabaena socialis TaxID=47790 RepID=A0A2J8AE20_9CHLO|nr:hypothetical protein TSOC_002488 [Tetrabaena socialis]|eukprot:PNH10760.1 hypothetical protein TSOC_002488 [Tetrabaena socialis]
MAPPRSACASRSLSTGLDRKPSMPARRHSSRSRSDALAVMARMGTRQPSRRIASVASTPPITGMAMSISTTSVRPAAAAAAAGRRARPRALLPGGRVRLLLLLLRLLLLLLRRGARDALHRLQAVAGHLAVQAQAGQHLARHRLVDQVVLHQQHALPSQQPRVATQRQRRGAAAPGGSGGIASEEPSRLGGWAAQEVRAGSSRVEPPEVSVDAVEGAEGGRAAAPPPEAGGGSADAAEASP